MNNNSLQNANIHATCKTCSDRKFEESIMAAQFAVIYFHADYRDCVSLILDDSTCYLFITDQSFSLAEYVIRATSFNKLLYLSQDASYFTFESNLHLVAWKWVFEWYFWDLLKEF